MECCHDKRQTFSGVKSGSILGRGSLGPEKGRQKELLGTRTVFSPISGNIRYEEPEETRLRTLRKKKKEERKASLALLQRLKKRGGKKVVAKRGKSEGGLRRVRKGNGKTSFRMGGA